MTTLDSILEIVPGERATAIRHVPQTLDVFTTHFPLFPVLPGVLILDDLVEVAGLVLAGRPNGSRIRWELAGVRRIRFRHFVEPGDSMEISVQLTRLVDGVAECRGLVQVDGRSVTIVTELYLRPTVRQAAA
ncbi:MAG: hydroxymyristoyl-ACP dehydratase [Nakamurella sp.]